MPQFIDPFPGNVPERKMTLAELVRALRQDLAAEHEAVHLYLAHADATDNVLAKTVLIDIANEERIHAGEFGHLIALLTGDEDGWLAKGAVEVDQMAAAVQASEARPAATAGEASTIGSLRGD